MHFGPVGRHVAGPAHESAIASPTDRPTVYQSSCCCVTAPCCRRASVPNNAAFTLDAVPCDAVRHVESFSLQYAVV